MRARAWSASLVIAVMATTACSFEHTSELLTPTMPSIDGSPGLPPGDLGPLMGLWASQEPLGNPASWVCGSFQWNISEQTPTSIAGSFAGICAGIVLVEGNGTGQLSGTTVTLNVSGQASVSGVTTTCPFSLSGTGQLEGEHAIHVNYSGSTCLGPVQGSETLRRPGAGEPPPPAPAVPPPPAPDMSSGHQFHVGPGPLNGDRAFDILEATSAEYPHLAAPHPTESQAVAAAEELLLRYIWHLQLAGFEAGRQRNPSGAISNDKLTIRMDGRWRAFDVFFDYGAPNQQMQLIFFEVEPPSHIPDPGISD